MNGTKFIFLLVFLLLVVGGIVFLYFYFEAGKQDIDSQYTDLFIKAFDGKHPVAIGFEVYVNGSKYKEGKTITKAYTVVKIPVNSSWRILTKNSEKYDFYRKEIKGVNGSKIKIKLEKPGELEKYSLGRLGRDEEIYIKLSSDGIAKDLGMCVKWTYGILNVNIRDKKVMSIPNKLSNQDKCWDLDATLENSEIEMYVDYEIFGRLISDDFLNFTIFDRELGKVGSIRENIIII